MPGCVSLVVFEKVSLGFGKKVIVDELDLRIGEQDRAGLVGPNGSGKSTLLRILAGEQGADSGKIQLSKNVRAGYLPQDIALQGGRTLSQFVRDSVPGREGIEAQIATLEVELASLQTRVEAGEEALSERMMELAQSLSERLQELSHFELHYSEHEAHRILAGLGFAAEDLERDLSEFSGGWKMRAVLAALLFQRPDLLLLDEPTNHLDMPSVAWFGDFLRRYDRAFVLICHDREFLNEQIERVITFESEGVRQYRGNYEHYRKQREEEEIVLENKARNFEKEREKNQQFIDRFRAQANKAKAVQSRVKALERMESVTTFKRREVMRFRFPPCERSGNEVVKVEGLHKAYGERRVFDGLDLLAMRGQKIGIIGVNGAGKTTLLRMIAGELPHDRGEVCFGHKVEAGYYAQHHAESLNPENTVFEEVASQDPSAGQTRVRSILGAFLYSGDDVDKKVQVLSGGERARVALAKLLLCPGNLLLMDEPTNHLDLESSESLAESLSSYDGTLLFVSHNRSFIRRLATQIWVVAEGGVEVYPGTLDEYLHACRLRDVSNPAASGAETESARRLPATEAESLKRSRGGEAEGKEDGGAEKRVRGSRKEEKERKRREAEARQEKNRRLKPLRARVESLESQIAKLEEVQKQRNLELASPELYEDGARRDALLKEYQQVAQELEALNEAWEMATVELEEAEEA